MGNAPVLKNTITSIDNNEKRNLNLFSLNDRFLNLKENIFRLQTNKYENRIVINKRKYVLSKIFE